MGTAAKLFFTDSERDADLFYLTGFHVGDPIACLVVDGRNILVLNDLEKDRAAGYPKVHEVVRLVTAEKQAKEESGSLPPRGVARTALVLKSMADERGIESFDVAGNFPVALADALRSQGLGLRWCRPPFIPERACKSAEEVEAIRGAIRATEAGMRAGIERIRQAEIKDGMLFEEGQALTSEMVRRTINKTLLDHDAFCESTIVAGGLQAVDPHDRGSGPLAAHSPIILDVFPRHFPTRYHGDMTRTVVRGQASDDVKRMHDAVLAAKLRGEELIKPGVDGKDVHAEVIRVIEEAGFVTEERDGRMVGFFHGTGHGLGLDVHEYPGIGKASYELKAGHVVTVEPGLYYPAHGGLRIEDDVLVTDSGCENLCTMEIELEI